MTLLNYWHIYLNSEYCRDVIVMYYVMEIEQKLFNRWQTTNMQLNLEILKFYIFNSNVLLHCVK